MDLTKERIRDSVARCLYKSFLIVAGGSIVTDDDENDERRKLRETASSSVCFPTKNPLSVEGKPHDIESRFVLSCFHRLRRTQASKEGIVELCSDMGLVRQIRSPKEMAELLLLPLEEECRREGHIHDIRIHSSGLIYLVTMERSHLLRQAGRLPCPICIQWCHGEKGLWWHQQQNHKIEHSTATEVAASSMDVWAVIPYNSIIMNSASSAVSSQSTNTPPLVNVVPVMDPLDFVKDGNLDALKYEIERNGYIPAHALDRKGASPVMWAAGGGHIDILRYLVETCGCDPNQPQRGKRSFSGRTPLHWAGRNGHLPVVEYLIRDCQVDMEASTIDGTTAFGWSSWQGHLDVMNFLFENRCNIHSINSFGCNAALWAAQGKGDTTIMEWLRTRHCDMTLVNNNGHGVLHKAAQRGHLQMCSWFFKNYIERSTDVNFILRLIGPDTEGYCPSDLAGMEGHEELARTLVKFEMDVAGLNPPWNGPELPTWVTETQQGMSIRISDKELYSWEKYGGVRRIRSKLSHRS